jgi:hypothetical protein
VSRFAKGISEDHLTYFGGLKTLKLLDKRAAYTPEMCKGVNERELIPIWEKFDEQYRSRDRISRFWVAELRNAIIYPPHGIVTVDRRIVRESIRSKEQLATFFPDISKDIVNSAFSNENLEIKGVLQKPTRKLNGISFLLGFGMYENYFNWTLRYTSRIGLYQAQKEANRLIVPPLTKGYIADTLEHYGIKQDECCQLNAPLLCERLMFISPVALGRYELSPLITETLRNHPRVHGIWRTEKQPLYIPRHNVKMRFVTNEADVAAALKKQGFYMFDNAVSSIHEQIKSFRNASIIVAPHGAGLSNIVYCEKATPVVEIVPEGYDQGVTSYRSLADLFELSYTQLMAQEARPNRKGNRCNSDITVDIKQLIRLVEQVRPS